MMKRVACSPGSVLPLRPPLAVGFTVPRSADAQVVQVSASATLAIRSTSTLATSRCARLESRDERGRPAGQPHRPGQARSDLVARFEIGDFNGSTFGGEWLVRLSNYLEVGAGVGYYQKTCRASIATSTDDDGTEIAQDLKLRIVPMTATVRFLPLGRGSGIEPYVGGGHRLLQLALHRDRRVRRTSPTTHLHTCDRYIGERHARSGR